LELIENRLFNYVSCKLAENVSDPIFLPWDQKISLKNNEYNQKFSSLTNLIYRNEKKIRQYLKDKSLLKYQREYHCIFRNKPHVLSPIENLTISKISINNDAIGSVFSTLLDEDIKFRDALDKNNKSIKLETFAKIQQLLKSSDRVLRKNA
jgi:oligoendopeptidase F